MSFNLRKPALLILFIITGLFIFGCAGENQPFQIEPEVFGEEQCMSHVGKNMEDYMHGRLSQGEVIRLWDCMSDAVDKFLKFTKGKEQQHYFGHEIANFLHKFFLGSIRLTPAFIEEMMEVKRLFLGGNANFATRQELLKTHELLSEFKRLTVELQPAMPILYGALQGDASIDPAQYDEAAKKFQKFSSEFGGMLQRKNSHYRFSNLQRLLEELSSLIKKQNPKSTLGQIVLYIPVLRKCKSILVGQPEDSIASDQWQIILGIIARGINSFVRFDLFVPTEEWYSGRGFDQLNLVMDEVLQLADEGFERRPGKQIPLHEFDELLETLEPLGLLPMGLDVEKAKKTLRVAIHRFMSVRDDGQMLPPGEVLRREHLQLLKNELAYWRSAQEYVNQVTSGNIDSGRSLGAAAEEMKMVAAGPWPLLQDEKGRLKFSLNPNDVYDAKSLSQLNWQRQIIRLLMRSYAGDRQRRVQPTGLLESELKTMAEELAPLGAALGLFDETNINIYKRIYFEGNLFMPRANGNDMLDFAEGIEYLSFALSGLSAQTMILEQMKTVCPILEDKGKTFLDVSCFRQKVILRSELFAHLPHLWSFLNSPLPGLWNDFEKYMEITVRDGGFSERPIPTSEIVEMWILLQYIETFYARFDADRTTTINLVESINAFNQVYKGPLQDILSGAIVGEDDVLAFFTFMLKTGQTPFTTDGMGGGVKFNNWKWHRHKWVFEANRQRLVQILATLSSL